MTGLRVAFDLDGVLADLDERYSAATKAVFGSTASRVGSTEAAQPGLERQGQPPARRSASPLTRDQQSKVWQRIAQTRDFWRTLTPHEPHVVRGIRSLATRYHWHVFFVTQRPDSAGETTQRQTQRWLIDHGFDLPTVIVMRGSRGRLAELLQLDVLVDDTPKHCVDILAESKAHPILVVRGDRSDTTSRAEGLGIQVVQSVREALVSLRRLSVERARPTMWQRLNRRVGRR